MVKPAATPQKNPTSFDVARRAGVSQTTVSRVYSEKWAGKISADTVEKVMQAAEELGYRKNAIAMGLSIRRTGIVGIIRTKEFNAFYDNIISLIISLLAKSGIHVMVFNAGIHSDINEVLGSAASYQLDGIILTSANLTHRISSHWVDSDIPIVLINSSTGSSGCGHVYSDNRGGTAQMARLFYDNGLRRIAYVSSSRSPQQNQQERQAGFLDTLAALPDVEDVIVVHGDYSYQSGIDAAHQLLSRPRPPQAVFCANERMALGVMDAARYLHGLRVPDDLSVAGFDDSDVSRQLSYSLTALQQQPELLAQAAVDLLLKSIESGSRCTDTVCIPQRLVVRGSVLLKSQLHSAAVR